MGLSVPLPGFLGLRRGLCGEGLAIAIVTALTGSEGDSRCAWSGGFARVSRAGVEVTLPDYE